MTILEGLQNSAFTEWFLGSESLWAYPTVLTLHTVGLAILVGSSVVLHLRLLGVGRGVPLARLKKLYDFIWPAFVVNLASGLVLFVTQAADRAGQPLFYAKMLSIGLALWIGQHARRHVFDNPQVTDVPWQMQTYAIGALVLWSLAILTGRLMAYVTG